MIQADLCDMFKETLQKCLYIYHNGTSLPLVS